MKVSLPLNLNIDEEIILRSLCEEDADLLFTLVDQNRLYLREFLGWLDNNTLKEDTVAFLRDQQKQLDQMKVVHIGILYNHQLVGVISLDAIDQLNKSASIGYWISKHYQGRGIMTKSTKSLIKYAFESLSLHRIEIKCAVHNIKSQKIVETLGFSKEGLLKEAISHYGEYFDAYIYGLINPLN